MALEIYDRVKETTTTTGTGTITLAGAATGFRAFGTVLADADTTYYAIEGGAEWEVGLGTIGGGGTTLARTSVLASSNAGAAVNFSAGTKNVFVTTPAALFSTAVATFLATPSSANLATLLTDDAFSMADAELGALAGLTSAADKLPYFTGSGTAALADLPAAMRTFLTTPSSANFASLVSDDAFSLADAELGAIAGLTSAADRLPYFTGSGTAALATFTAGGRALVNSAGTANTFPYFSASNTVTLGSITTAGRNILDDADAAAQRTTLAAAGSGAITSSGLTMTTARILGRTTASTGAVQELSQVPYSLGGTNATTSWTQGSILFAGASALAQDNTNLYWDDTNNLLGVGGTPSYRLDVQHNTNAAHGIAMRNASTGASSQSFIRCETGTTNAFFNVACLDNAGAPYAQFSVGSAITALFFLSDTQVWSNSSGVEMGRITASALTATGNAGILTGTAIPAGGTAGSGYKFSSTSNFGLFFGSGAPSLSAARGSFYLRSDGLAPYTNINGTTGWMPIYGNAGPVIKVADWTVADTEQSFVSNRGASNTVTLPTASSFPGRWIYIKTIQAQTVVSASSNVKPLVSDTAGTAILPATDGAWAALQSDGSNWILMMGSAV